MRDRYDDGGFSGGSMERPALKKLLDAVRARRIDVIVVYKVDRLTRSLADFAKLVELFDEHRVSFVSVTQAFNTTTSMGRLTLNVLLSFAQFEREVTGERIRDKIAASKKKGIWMGGVVPLGYRVDNRALHVVEEHAAFVRNLFRRYLEIGSVVRLKAALDQENVRLPVRTDGRGKITGGGLISRGHLYKILSNPIYIGRLTHKDQVHEGLHAPIVDHRAGTGSNASLPSIPKTDRARATTLTPCLPVSSLMIAGLVASRRPTSADLGNGILRPETLNRHPPPRAAETVEWTWQTDDRRRKSRKCRAILRTRKSRQFARNSWCMALSLSFLSPVLVKAAIEGRLSRGFGVKRLMDLPMAWSDQWSALGLKAPHADLIELDLFNPSPAAHQSHSEIGAAFRFPTLVASRGRPARIWETGFCGQRLAAASSRERRTDPPNGRRRPRSTVLTLYESRDF
jgi:DNA invertase Pin-like site-specific DNA recombinase